MKNLQRFGGILVIIAAVFLVYWPALRNGFVWDDTALVQRDPLIRSWRLIPEGFRHFLFLDATASSFYRPLQRLTFTLDYALWDRSAGGWHLTSIYMHIGAAIALYFLAGRMLGHRGKACVVALLWAVHPLHTSAVTYISGRADPLQAMFGFTALGLAGRSLEKRLHLADAGAALCFLCAALSKEAGLFALAIWFAVLAWLRAPRAAWWKWLALGGAVVAVYSALRFAAQSTPPPQEAATPHAARPILAARAVAEYAGLILAPVNLRMERDVSSGVGNPTERDANAARREWQTLLGLALMAAAIAWWCRARQRTPVAGLAALCGVIAYVPVSNLLSLNASVAEHWLYVPLAFWFVAAAAAIPETPPLVVRLALAIWMGWLGFRTWQRQPDWKDQRTFLERTIAAGGDSARMRVNLGRLESAEGHDDRALEQLREALRREPGQPFALFSAASVLVRLGQLDAAEPLLDKAAAHPALATECRILRATLRKLKTNGDIAPELREAAESAPFYWPAWRRYFAELDRSDRRAEAIRELRAFLERQPFRAESWAMLGDLLAKERDNSAAAAAFIEATRRDVHDAESHHRIAILERTPPKGNPQHPPAARSALEPKN